ncbi:MAG: rhodanese-like domain-containing protein [Proteobacteria bacterium]|nr:rhodanese-like domain-containing protein [Pseudomonadota bacterium]
MAIKNVFAEIDEKKKSIENLSVDQLKAEMATNKDLLLLDIREIQELVELGSIPGSVHVARGMLEFWADPSSPYYRDYFTEDKRIITYCAGGGRSVLAVEALKNMGFKNVAHLEPGFGGWKKAEEEIFDFAATSRWMRRPKE